MRSCAEKDELVVNKLEGLSVYKLYDKFSSLNKWLFKHVFVPKYRYVPIGSNFKHYLLSVFFICCLQACLLVQLSVMYVSQEKKSMYVTQTCTNPNHKNNSFYFFLVQNDSKVN